MLVLLWESLVKSLPTLESQFSHLFSDGELLSTDQRESALDDLEEHHVVLKDWLGNPGNGKAKGCQ